VDEKELSSLSKQQKIGLLQPASIGGTTPKPGLLFFHWASEAELHLQILHLNKFK